MSDEQIENAVALFKKHGIRVMLQNMIGLPNTTFENDLETLEFNVRCQPDYAWVSIFQPYPKTQLGEYAVKIGQYKGDFSDIGSNFFDSTPLELPHANKLANLQKLFAFAVQNPDLYQQGAIHRAVLTNDPNAKEVFRVIYKRVRKEADRVLYGMEL